MATEDIEKKDLVRTVLLKDVDIKSLGETLSLMKLEVSQETVVSKNYEKKTWRC